MASLLCGDASPVDLSPFAPARFAPKASRRGRKKQHQDVGEQW